MAFVNFNVYINVPRPVMPPQNNIKFRRKKLVQQSLAPELDVLAKYFGVVNFENLEISWDFRFLEFVSRKKRTE